MYEGKAPSDRERRAIGLVGPAPFLSPIYKLRDAGDYAVCEQYVGVKLGKCK